MSTGITIHHAFAYLRLRSAAEAIEFYKKVFGAVELFRLSEPSGRIGHAEIKLGDTVIMLSDEYPESGVRGPATLGGTTVAIHLHVDHVDDLVARAVEAGATITRPLQNQFYGERTGVVRDPFGHEWLLGEQIEEMTPEEMQRKYTELMQSAS